MTVRSWALGNLAADGILKSTDAAPIECECRRWIPTTERLPERNEIVLATDQDGVTIGSYSRMLDDWWTLHGDRMAPGAIVAHWMPLPKPPDAT